MADASATRRIVDTLCGLTWPLNQSDITRIADELGWTPTRSTSRSARFTTGIVVAPDRVSTASASLAGGTVSQIQVDLSREPGDGTSDVAHCRRVLTERVIDRLGPPVTAQGTDTGWDLADGARVWLRTLNSHLALITIQPKHADIERAESPPSQS